MQAAHAIRGTLCFHCSIKAQRGACRLRALCLRALFGKPRPPEESLQSALFNHHCLMTCCHALK